MMLASKAKQEALIHGYIREESKSNKCNIPLCINQYFLKFYNEATHITFTKDQLVDFLTTENGDCWELEKPITTNNLKFTLN